MIKHCEVQWFNLFIIITGYNSSYFCAKQSMCEIRLKTRKSCQYCRYQRCLDAGMKASWVITDEERRQKLSKCSLSIVSSVQDSVVLTGCHSATPRHPVSIHHITCATLSFLQLSSSLSLLLFILLQCLLDSKTLYYSDYLGDIKHRAF